MGHGGYSTRDWDHFSTKRKYSDPKTTTRDIYSRDGDGPMFNEFELPYENIEDPSNPENPYQGKMRYGLLDKRWYQKAINEITDDTRIKSCGVAMTCTDHINVELEDYSNIKIVSRGPAEKNIQKV